MYDLVKSEFIHAQNISSEAFTKCNFAIVVVKCRLQGTSTRVWDLLKSAKTRKQIERSQESCLSHLQVGKSKDDRVHKEDTTRFLVDGGSDNLWIDNKWGAKWTNFTSKLDCGILSRKEKSQIIVEDENNFDHPYGTKGKEISPIAWDVIDRINYC